MTAHLASAKASLREQIRAHLKSLSPTRRLDDSTAICVRLPLQEVWRQSVSIVFFASLPDEPDIWPLVTQALLGGKIVALPRFSRQSQAYEVCQVRDLQAAVRIGAFGIREPSGDCPVVPLNQLDLVLVPGVAFDLHGRRLGRGKGFYDRLLAGVSGIKCGIAFDEQIVGEVPAGPHDIHLNCILTPTRWIET
jgi:5-formyltetrahydrofolate cyclo-ligase